MNNDCPYCGQELKAIIKQFKFGMGNTGINSNTIRFTVRRLS